MVNPTSYDYTVTYQTGVVTTESITLGAGEEQMLLLQNDEGYVNFTDRRFQYRYRNRDLLATRGRNHALSVKKHNLLSPLKTLVVRSLIQNHMNGSSSTKTAKLTRYD